HSTSWEERPVSGHTFSRFRRRCYLYELESGIDLIHDEMQALSDKLMEYFEVSSTKKRRDSVRSASIPRTQCRPELLHTCIERLVRKIEKDYPSFDVSEYQRYLDSSHENEFIYHSDQPYNDKMQDILLDAFGLNETFESTLKEDT